MSAEEIMNAVSVMSAQIQQVQTALATEQATTADLRQNLESLRRLGRNRRCHQEAPDERTLSEEVHQHASV